MTFIQRVNRILKHDRRRTRRNSLLRWSHSDPAEVLEARTLLSATVLDADDNGEQDSQTDGVLAIRQLAGFSGDVLVSGALGNGANRSDAAAIDSFWNQPDVASRLDIDGNGRHEPLSDGILAIRYLEGTRGDALINGVIADGSTRTTSEEIVAYLDGLADGFNRSPVVDDPGTLTVSPGETLQVNLTASDPDGDSTAIAITSETGLPFAELDQAGRLTLRPSAGDLGSHEITIVASDGASTGSFATSITVAGDGNTDTRISGVVLDTDASSLPNVVVELGSLTTTTNASGEFQFSTSGEFSSDRVVFRGDLIADGGRTFPKLTEPVSLLLGHALYEGFNNPIAQPIFLPALNMDSAQSIDPTQETQVTVPLRSGEAPASLTVAAGTLKDADGNDFTGELTITEVPLDRTPAPLPDNLHPDLVVTIQTEGLVFETPAPLTLPNRANYAAGSPMDLWAVDAETGEFVIVGSGRVSDDGTMIETITGGIIGSSWHCFTPNQTAGNNGWICPGPVEPPPGYDPFADLRNCTPRPGERGPESEPPDDECEECKSRESITSDVELMTGTLTETHSLPTYSSAGQTRGITLVYDSLRADPRPIVSMNGTFNGVNEESRFTGQLFVHVDGTTQNVSSGEHYWRLPIDQFVNHRQVGQLGRVDASLQMDLTPFESGVYSYATSAGLGQLAGSEMYGRNYYSSGQIITVNRMEGPIGAGWGIAGLQEIVLADDGSALLIDGNGGESLFRKMEEGSGFISPRGDFSVLELTNAGTFRRTMKDQTVYQFDEDLRLSFVEDRNGNRTTYVYTDAGQISEIIDPAGLSTSFEYRDQLLARIVDPASRETELIYDEKGNLKSIQNPDGTTRRWKYDDRHHMVQETDELGNVEVTVYDEAGRVRSATRKDQMPLAVTSSQSQAFYTDTSNPDSEAMARFIDEANPADFMDANGNQSRRRLDAAGQLVSSEDEIGERGSVSRNADNLVNTSNDARGGQTVFNYDDRGNLTSSRDEVGEWMLMEYDATFSVMTRQTDQEGRITNYEIDQTNGNVLSMTRIVGAEGGTDDLQTSYTYTTYGLIDTITDPLGRVTDYDYDAVGRLVSITMAVGTADEAAQRFEYDQAGNQSAMIDENGNRTDYEYDSMNRLIRISEPDAGQGRPVTTFGYDGRGNLLTTTDANGNTTTNVYDPLDRLIQSTASDPDGDGTLEAPVTRFEYDGVGNLTLTVDPLGNETRNRYDARNRLTETIDPDGGSTRFEYDLNDNMTKLTDPVGNATTFVYDAKNRLIEEIDPLGKSTHYEYDAVDNLIRKTDRLERVTRFHYDELNRLLQEDWLADDGSQVNQIDYVYDKASNLLSVQDSASALAFTYDHRDRVDTVDNAGTPGATQVLLEYGYDGVGNVTSVTDTIAGQAGAVTGYEYDALNRVTSITQTGNDVSDKRVDFAYNQLGQYDEITRYSDLNANQLVVATDYAYDELNRLTDLVHNNGTTDVAFYRYQYDSASRISQIVDIDGVTDYSYDDRSQLTGANRSADDPRGDEFYEYDANGNRVNSHLHGDGYVTDTANRLISDGIYTYSYDDEGNMVLRAAVDGSTRSFEYDSRNRLIVVTDRDPSNAVILTVAYAYDVIGRRLMKSVDHGSGTVETHFVYNREAIYLETRGGATIRYVHAIQPDNVLAQEAAGTLAWFLTDHLNSTRTLTDSAGIVLQRFTFDSQGRLIEDVDPQTRFLFTGREFEPELGINYHRARYLDLNLGRFISEDPMAFGGADSNLFRYAGNMPIRSVDTYGLMTTEVTGTWFPKKPEWSDVVSSLSVVRGEQRLRIRVNPGGKIGLGLIEQDAHGTVSGTFGIKCKVESVSECGERRITEFAASVTVSASSVVTIGGGVTLTMLNVFYNYPKTAFDLVGAFEKYSNIKQRFREAVSRVNPQTICERLAARR